MKSKDLSIDIEMAENGGIVVKYTDRDEDQDDGPMMPRQKTYTFKTPKEVASQVESWLSDEAGEEKDEVPTEKDSVKAHLHEKSMGSTAKEMKQKGY